MAEKRKSVWANIYDAGALDVRPEDDWEFIARQWRESQYAALNARRNLWRAASEEAGFRLAMSRDAAALVETPEDAVKWAAHHARIKAELVELRAMQSEVDVEAQKRRTAIELGVIQPPAEIRPSTIPAPMATFKWPGQ